MKIELTKLMFLLLLWLPISQKPVRIQKIYYAYHSPILWGFPNFLRCTHIIVSSMSTSKKEQIQLQHTESVNVPWFVFFLGGGVGGDFFFKYNRVPVRKTKPESIIVSGQNFLRDTKIDTMQIVCSQDFKGTDNPFKFTKEKSVHQ